MASIATLLSRTRRLRLTLDLKPAQPRLSKVRSVPTFLGWTPGLRGLVSGRVLRCGCLVGFYETQVGGVIEILDGLGPCCEDRTHVLNRVGEPLDPISREGV